MLIRNTQKLVLISTVFILGLASLTSCTWVKNAPNSQAVRIVPADRMMGCRLLSKATTYTADNITLIKRSAKKVQEELDALAKNEAVERGADTIVRTSRVIEGKQSFDLYRCLK